MRLLKIVLYTIIGAVIGSVIYFLLVDGQLPDDLGVSMLMNFGGAAGAGAGFFSGFSSMSRSNRDDDDFADPYDHDGFGSAGPN